MNEWPNNVTPAIDCEFINNEDEVVHEDDLVWNVRRGRWEVPPVSVWNFTIRNFNTVMNGMIALARPRYSRENPPPAPAGCVLLGREDATVGQCMQYVRGSGWKRWADGVTFINGVNSLVLAFARNVQTPAGAPPDNYEVFTPDQREFYRPFIHQVWVDGDWRFLGDYFERFDQLGLPAARRILPVSTLPIEPLQGWENNRIGDFCYDREGGWLPFVGPPDAQIKDWLNNNIWGMARLKPEFMAEGFNLCSLHNPILPHNQVLVMEGEAFVWKGFDVIPLEWVATTYAFMVPEIIAMREPVAIADGLPPRAPLAQWMSAELRAMLETDVTSDQFRGLVRRNHHLIIPREMHAAGNVAAITIWLEEAYAADHPHEEQINLIRVYTERTALAVRAAIQPVPQFLGFDDVAPAIRVRYELNERVTQRNERYDRLRGYVNIPRDVFNRGEEAVRRYIMDHYIEQGDWDRDQGTWEQVGDGDEYEFSDLETTNYQEINTRMNEDDEDEDEPDERDEGANVGDTGVTNF